MRQTATASPTGLADVTAEAAAEGVEKGIAAFVKPEPMQVNVPSTIKFIAGPDQQSLVSQSAGPLAPAGAVYIGKAMQVRLFPNPSFEIKARSDARQLTHGDRTATWSWDVTPLNDKADRLEAEI